MVLKREISVIVLCFLALGLILTVVPAAFGQEPLNIGLLRFEAIPAEEGIRLEWDVETELGTAGYTIKRAQGEEAFDYLRDPGGNGSLFIFAEGGPAQRYSYVFVDDTAIREKTYSYQLVEITTSSREQIQASETVTYHIEPTATPITFSGDLGGSGGGNQGSQVTATATPLPTSTPRPQATSTSAPPPTSVAPTPLPSPTTVQPTAAPASSAPLQPVASPPSNTVYPAAEVSGPDVDSAASESLPYTEEVDPQPPDAEDPPLSTVNPAPDQVAAEAPPDSSSGIASALVISGDHQAKKEVLPVIEPADGSPIVIEEMGSVTAATLIQDETQQEITDEGTANVASSRVLLWVAFIIALAIFSASVVGTILLYSRRPPLK